MRPCTRLLPTCVLALTVLLGGLLTGCSFDNADRYADEYAGFARSLPDVEGATVSGHNAVLSDGTVNSLVTLRGGLSDAQVAAVAEQLVSHPPERSVERHDVVLRFSATNGSGGEASVSLHLEPVSGTSQSEPELVERVAAVRALAADSSGLTDLTDFGTSIHVDTTGDVFATASLLDKYARTVPTRPRQLVSAQKNGNVSWDRGDDLAALQGMSDVLAAIPAAWAPVFWRADAQQPVDEPRFTIVMPKQTPDNVFRRVRNRALEVVVPVDLSRAA
ncbi:hypothetical protein [Gordonia liuliyuniae]|uniref:Lipoprotein n=1 Tax=Gordonia liuliyuniae TaxID=2911517 RepID=A0ABS9IR05_9ACTN|nr:hypothetical protein [Gordonia liuliyuniae]MCF8587984.1 hypothetical protein [Gordonia liuliyuniae]